MTCLIAVMWLVFVGALPAHSQEIKSCEMGSAGGACIFELDAFADGRIEVTTRSTIAGQRWRAAIAVAGAKAITSAISSGDSTAFSGRATRLVRAGRKYEAIIIYEMPLPSVFPTAVDVRIDGPVNVSDARDGSFLPVADRYMGRGSATFFFSFLVAPDGRSIAEVRATNHECLGALLSFTLTLEPDVVPIRRGADGRLRFEARNIPLPNDRTLDFEGVLFNADGVDNTSEQALGATSIVIPLGRCNHRWVATAVALDSDLDRWSDTAELRLGSSPTDSSSVPEHWEVPTTTLYGPDSCHDLADNDDDGSVDGSDTGCTP